MVKKGDTLIEVALAIGIFSMVAIAVVTVMTGGTSSTQTALETTLAREEIDVQAEALRFIHDSYITDDVADNVYTKVWKKITDNAVDIKNSSNPTKYTQYNPTSCQKDIYENDDITSKAFVINPRAFSGKNISDIYVKYNNSIFRQTPTYPRLMYKNETLLGSGDKLEHVEGLYVLAVKDPDTTNIIGGKGSAYYDFYIRTCWYGTGSEMPTAISTVIRLYDPEGIKQK